MIKLFAKWVAPGLVTVMGGTALAVLMTSANVAADIENRATADLVQGDAAWAELTVDGRDLVLHGTTVDQPSVDTAVWRLQSLHGVRSVTADVQIAPLASPYPFTASIDNGKITLRGGVPDLATRDRLLARSGAESDDLKVLSGMPKRADWLAGVEFAVDQLQHFDRGRVAAADLDFTLSGRARSRDDFSDVLLAVQNDTPKAVTLADVVITPPLVTPYRWSATSDGQRIQLSGYVPDTATTERLRLADTGGLPVATGLTTGSGEPAAFADSALRLLENLARLEYGTASIVDGKQTLTGGPASPEIARRVTQDLAQAGSIVTLDAPRIADYWLSATRQSGGVIVFDGFAPDETTRKRLARVEGADVSFLKLGRGEPERYQAAVDFGLSLLEHLSEGRFALRANIVTMTGIARSGTDYEALEALIAAGPPQGIVLAMSEVKAPVAAPFLWSATKSADGSLKLSGMVPDAAAKASLASAQGAPDTAVLTYASGEPAGFVASATTALDLLHWLDSGSVSYDGTDWAVSGTSPSAINSGAIEAEFVTRKLAAAGWSLDVTTTPAAIAPPPVSPYTWSATRSASGTVALTGHVPTEAMKKFLAIHAGADVTDTTEVGAGAPAEFIKETLAALDAVLALDSGKANFDGKHWILTGAASSVAARDAVLAPLGAAVDLNQWTVNITVPAPAAVTPPKAKPETTEPETAPVQPEAAEPESIEPPVAESAEPSLDPAYAFSATRADDGAVVMSGMLPADPALRFFSVITGAPATGVTIAPGAPEDFILSAETGLRGLIQLQNGELKFASGKWSLSGKAPTNAARDTVLASIATLPAGAGWNTNITAPPPLDACQAKVTEFSARNAILFQSGAAIIAEDSEAALDELASYLALCPEADVDIEGHTDADGDDQLNLALSVARAEAVVKALITRNVDRSRLYAIGYGESDPIADNDTSAGKRLNRRIVVKVLEHHED